MIALAWGERPLPEEAPANRAARARLAAWESKISRAVFNIAAFDETDEVVAVRALSRPPDCLRIEGRTLDEAREFDRTAEFLWEASVSLSPVLARIASSHTPGQAVALATEMKNRPFSVAVGGRRVVERGIYEASGGEKDFQSLDMMLDFLEESFEHCKKILSRFRNVRARVEAKLADIESKAQSGAEGRSGEIEVLRRQAARDPLSAWDALFALEAAVVRDVAARAAASELRVGAAARLRAVRESEGHGGPLGAALEAWLGRIEAGPWAGGRFRAAQAGLESWTAAAEEGLAMLVRRRNAERGA